MEEVKKEELGEQVKWVFIPVNKTRVIKETDKYILLDLRATDDIDAKVSVSTIVNIVFKRKKETEDKIFISLPQNFKFNVRTSWWSQEKNRYVETNDTADMFDFISGYKALLDSVVR